MHGLHAREGILNEVLRDNHMIAVQVDTLRGVLNMIAKNTRLIGHLGATHVDGRALMPDVDVFLVPDFLINQ